MGCAPRLGAQATSLRRGQAGTGPALTISRSTIGPTRTMIPEWPVKASDAGGRLVGRDMWASGSAAGADISGDPPIPGFNELDRALAVCEVRIDGCRQRGGVEALEW